MGCGPAQPEAPEAKGNKGITIYGDYFSADTRALIVMCDIAEIEYTLEMIDTLNNDHSKDTYLALNPTGAIPMLTVGNNNVISQGQVLFDWIIQTSDKAKGHFHHDDQENKIKAIQRYFFREMRSNTSQLIRRLALKVVDP